MKTPQVLHESHYEAAPFLLLAPVILFALFVITLFLDQNHSFPW